MDSVVPYDLDLANELEVTPNNGLLNLQQFLAAEEPVTAAQYDELQRYVAEHVRDESGTDLEHFLHAPYQERRAPGKAATLREEQRNRPREDSRGVESRKLAQAMTEIANKDKLIAKLQAANQELTTTNMALSAQCDHWRKMVESTWQAPRTTPPKSSPPAPANAPLPHTGGAGGAAAGGDQAHQHSPMEGFVATSMPHESTLLGTASPASSVASTATGTTNASTTTTPRSGPLKPASQVLAEMMARGNNASDTAEFLREVDLQERYRKLQTSVEKQDSSDSELSDACQAVIGTFCPRNEIPHEMADIMCSPEYLMRSFYLHPSEDDVREETEEERRNELGVWAQICHRAGYTQEQFEAFVRVRSNLGTGLRVILRARREINQQLRDYFRSKLGYLRRMNFVGVRSTPSDVMHAAQLLARLRGTCTAVIELRDQFVRSLVEMQTPRQLGLLLLQISQPSIYTSVAFSAMARLHLIQSAHSDPRITTAARAVI